jgi:hypothetical protein
MTAKKHDQHEAVEATEPDTLPPLDITKSPDDMTDAELVEALGIFFPRPPADPNAPPRPRPVVDAIKAMLGELIAQAGPVALPLLLQLLTKYLGQLGAAQAVSIAGTAEPYAYASRLANRHVPNTSELKADYRAASETAGVAADNAILEALINLLVQFANEIGPQLVPIILAAIKKLLGLPA